MGEINKIIRNRWAKQEEYFLINNYSAISPSDISKVLNRSKASILKKFNRMGLKGNKAKWTKDEIEFLKDNYKGEITDHIKIFLHNRTENGIRIMANRLDLTIRRN